MVRGRAGDPAVALAAPTTWRGRAAAGRALHGAPSAVFGGRIEGYGPRVISVGHAFVQNLCLGHYELDVEDRSHRLPAAFSELAPAI